MTKAEACLWKFVLRAKKMRGYTFNRQRPVLRYISDFMCRDLLLIIEVDGSIHQLEEVRKKDHEREKALKEAGFAILRFTNEEVLWEIEKVRTSIERWVAEREKELGLPPRI